MELEGLSSEKKAPNKQAQVVPHVNCPKQFGLGNNSFNVAFTVQDVYNPSQSTVQSDHHALFFSSNSLEGDHLQWIDVDTHGSNYMLRGTQDGFNNMGAYNYLDMDCKNVLGHVDVEKYDQIKSRGGYLEDRIMAQPAAHNVELGCPREPRVVNMNSSDANDRHLEQILGHNFTAPAESTACMNGNNGYKGEVIWRNSSYTSTALNQMTPVKNNAKNLKWIQGQWASEEDRLLEQLVGQHGLKKWSQIAEMLKGRKGKQCRDRWYNHLRPNIRKDTWTDEEDMVLIKGHMELGNKWAEIARRLPQRTENSIKNRWNATKRRQFSRKSRTAKCPKPTTLLQSYIMSLGLLPNPKSAHNEEGPTGNSSTKPTEEGMPRWAPFDVGPSCHLGNLAPVDDWPVDHVDVVEGVPFDDSMTMIRRMMTYDDPPSLLDV